MSPRWRWLFEWVLERSSEPPDQRWHAEFGVNILLVMMIAPWLVLFGIVPELGFRSGSAALMALSGIVATTGFVWTRRTGKWRPALCGVAAWFMMYIVLIHFQVGMSSPALAVSVAAMVGGTTYVFRSRWTWPILGVFIGVYVLASIRAVGRGEEMVLTLGRFITLTACQVLAAAMFRSVEWVRALAVSDAVRAVEVEQRARASQRVADSRSLFLATMSHEIRTPMNAVLHLQRLLRDTALNEEQTDLLDAAIVASESLLNVLNDVLDYSKIDAGQLSLDFVTFDAASLLHQVASVFRPETDAKAVALRVETPVGEDTWISSDVDRLRQVLTNLVSNAAKFTCEGEIVLRLLRHTAGGVTFQVEDSGIGIAAENLDAIFQPFVQVDSSSTRQVGGTGLGLAISRRLCEAMGGSLLVESTMSRGSRFSVELPPSVDAVVRPPQVFAASSLPVLDNCKVLVAEDNPINQQVIALLLKQMGITCALVNHGEDAVSWVQNHDVDLVLMDVHMPVLDGLAACRQIRALPGPESQTPVIALSASVLADDHRRSLAAGMNGHLGKTIQVEQLTQTLLTFLQHKTDGFAESVDEKLPLLFQHKSHAVMPSEKS